MRIGFDVSALERPHPPGIVRVTSALALALERRARIELVRLAPPPGRGLFVWRQLDLPHRARELALDGIHSPLSAFALAGPGKRVQTLHELPWRHGVHENAGLAHRFWASIGPRAADAVVTATEYVARELRAAIPELASRVHVIPWGVDARFRPGTSAPQGYVLCPGAVRAKKNLGATLQGAALCRVRPRVVVTGEPSEHLRGEHAHAAQLGLELEATGSVDDARMLELYRRASVVSVLSSSEGFGLPVLEALACGTPVLVPRASAQAEVAGVAGIEVDPDDPESVAAGIERAQRERVVLAALGLARASEFAWERCAERVERLWQELCP